VVPGSRDVTPTPRRGPTPDPLEDHQMSNRLKRSIRKLLLLWRMRRESAAFFKLHGPIVKIEPMSEKARRKGGRSC
jgi:hypothetical protein